MTPQSQQPLTAWQKLRVQAAAGLPVKVDAEMLRAIAKAGEHLEMMVEMNGELLKQRQPMLAGVERLIASSARLRRALLIWQIIAVLLGAGWLADMAGLI